MTSPFRPRVGRRVAAEVGYVIGCEVLLFFAWGTVWIYLLVLVTLPSSILPFIASAVGWGGLNRLGGDAGGVVITTLWMLTPPAQVALGRAALRWSGRTKML